ncbi:unnamed protein product, partial [Linum tenue]
LQYTAGLNCHLEKLLAFHRPNFGTSSDGDYVFLPLLIPHISDHFPPLAVVGYVIGFKVHPVISGVAMEYLLQHLPDLSWPVIIFIFSFQLGWHPERPFILPIADYQWMPANITNTSIN